MNVLVTGANGFIGKNLTARLMCEKDITVYGYDTDTDPGCLREYAKKADIVFHLAGVNRPKSEDEFMTGNFDLTKSLLEALDETKNFAAPFILSSSIQASLDNPYGISKKAAEDIVTEHAEKTGRKAVVYRFPNVFGKWCRPNYNSAVATFCHNIARGLPITVNDPDVEMHLVYIDDVVNELMLCLEGKEHVKNGRGYVPFEYTVKLGRIPELLYSFAGSRQSLMVPDMSDPFEKKLYSTYLSYLPEGKFSYPLVMHEDARGSFTEFLKTEERGQVSVNIAHPGIVKGNHWHNTKNEKFLVVKGEGLIKLRKVGTDEVSEYRVSADRLEVVDIPCGYIHSIQNVGKEDMATIMWVNEIFDPDNADTYPEEV